jgi:hypothetical protein
MRGGRPAWRVFFWPVRDPQALRSASCPQPPPAPPTAPPPSAPPQHPPTHPPTQVSHHPPIGAGHGETELWTYDLVSAPKTKFLGNSVEVYPIGGGGGGG